MRYYVCYICRFATQYLTRLLTPLVVLFALRSLLYEQHPSWYSWAIGACTGCVYSFGFVLMCPQLYINHQLKSVSHLPWKVGCVVVHEACIIHSLSSCCTTHDDFSKLILIYCSLAPFTIPCPTIVQYLVYKFLNTFIDGKLHTACVHTSCTL